MLITPQTPSYLPAPAPGTAPVPVPKTWVNKETSENNEGETNPPSLPSPLSLFHPQPAARGYGYVHVSSPLPSAVSN